MSAPRHPAGGVSRLPSLKIIDFERLPSGALEGFVTVETPSGVTIHGIAIFKQGGNRWCGLPKKPRLSKGKVLRANDGRVISDPVLEIQDEARKASFDRAVLVALDKYLTQECG